MKKFSIKSILFFLLLGVSKTSFGQQEIQQFDGKYGVFIAIALVVLVGLFAYLIRLDIKLRKIEKQQNN